MIEIFNENLFLVFLGLAWIIGAVLQDLKRKEVDNIWNFSLIPIALSYRFFYSAYTGEFMFVLNGFIGLFVFFILGNLLYHGRVFAGGDTKLLYSLGVVLPLSSSWIINLGIAISFIFLFLLTGGIYVFIWSLILCFKNFKNFKNRFIFELKNLKNLFYISFIFFIFSFIIGWFYSSFFIVGITFFLFPILFAYSKAIENCCMVKLVDSKDATEGDWLEKQVKIGKKIIKPDWNGLTKNDLKLLRKNNKKVWIKYGIPFTPGFLFGYLLLIYILEKGLFKVF